VVETTQSAPTTLVWEDVEVQNETWQPPGPGTWETDSSHFDTTVTPLMVEMIEHAAPTGMREGFDLIGAPLDTMDVRFVNGQMYRRLVPIIGGSGRGPSTPPPAWLTRTVFAVHPRLRKRAQTAARSLEARSWSGEADRWEATWKPELSATNRRLAAVDVISLSDEELAAHFDETLGHAGSAMLLHFRLHISDLGPIALLLDHTTDWGIDPGDVMPALAGASPATSAPQDALRPLAREIAAAGAHPTSLDEVRAVGEVAAQLLDEYILEFGTRLTTGYDLTHLTLAEMPDVILATVGDPRLLDAHTAAELAAERGEQALREVRASVAAEDRNLFDELITDARRLYGLRDENGPITAEWPCGILRLIMLEVGRRLVAAGRLRAVAHVFDLSAVEVSGSLRGEPGPHAEAVATRNGRRLQRADSEPPSYLGPAPVEPDLGGLPEVMGRMMRMSVNAVALLEAERDRGELRGTGVGTASYTGPARVVVDADEALERCQPGDVIIARYTVPTFNSVLALAGAVVTEQGGLLCHTAVIARELGIAAVVGASGALDIADGAMVEVDPVAGVVTVLA